MRIQGGQARGRKLGRPLREATRPPLARLRKSVFSILGDRVDGARVLDLFAGTGAFGLEALSLGARLAVFVERDPAAVAALADSLGALGFRGAGRVLRSDALDALDALEPALAALDAPERSFDIVFVDPPFAVLDDAAARGRLMLSIESLLAGPLLAPAGRIVLRVPIEAADGLEPPPDDLRRYGRSAVAFYLRAAPPAGATGGPAT